MRKQGVQELEAIIDTNIPDGFVKLTGSVSIVGGDTKNNNSIYISEDSYKNINTKDLEEMILKHMIKNSHLRIRLTAWKNN